MLRGHRLCHYKIPADKVKATYEGHEVAAHGCTHPRLEHLEKYEIIHQVEDDRKTLMELGKQFVEMQPDRQQIFYIWGHAYEMDYDSSNWMKLEEFFQLISGYDDIFYGTNAQVLL